jgi:hypothetical protein
VVIATKFFCNLFAGDPNGGGAGKKAQPGGSSVIIGSRTLEQLEANLKALDLTLTPEQIASLNDVSRPVLNFPADFLTHSPSYSHAGATVNGVPSQLTFLVPKDDSPRW